MNQPGESKINSNFEIVKMIDKAFIFLISKFGILKRKFTEGSFRVNLKNIIL
ncbi:hypothetical protein LEP1GSC082_1660 [Leptospira kirschneri str. H2]|uniref:Uncharacterized protein n=1 Tax=Leptospira kirschneri str. H1 TaxID=1049966 RepID=A0A0E2B5N7_9LEPT|nr:hypothetical protein LEP1GSC081_4047 [Leptospira kirschneri str. H1]EKO59002.1 hypothetical protein LEP1GSC082_1660 [Leptospira kirschneri str. H2]